MRFDESQGEQTGGGVAAADSAVDSAGDGAAGGSPEAASDESSTQFPTDSPTDSSTGLTSHELLRKIPAVDQMLTEPALKTAMLGNPRSEVVRVLRAELARLRAAGTAGELREAELEAAAIGAAVRAALAQRLRPYYRAVINATGVVLHTGLGRAPLAPEAVAALSRTAGSAQRLELELKSGERGGRDAGCAAMLCELTGCEAATVVNNNAGATLLVLAALARGKKVLLSRGEMVEIGGSYRVPEILRESGALLAEVGTTNRTHLADYRRALEACGREGGGEAGMLLKVHTSNYRVRGFTAEVEIEELVALAREHGLPVVHDLGSGSLLAQDEGRVLRDEPPVRRSIAAGADVVCFSGDKLLGGPQAGILAGRREAIERCRSHPLFRAMRPGRLIYTALEATLRLYRGGDAEALRRVPTLARLTASPEELQSRARNLAAHLVGTAYGGLEVAVVESEAQAGSGSLPDETVASWAVRLTPQDRSAHHLAEQLRTGRPSVVARVRDDAVLLDVRTLSEAELQPLAKAVQATLG